MIVAGNTHWLIWAALMAALLGLASWKNSRTYPRKSPFWRLGKAVINTGLVVLIRHAFSRPQPSSSPPVCMNAASR